MIGQLAVQAWAVAITLAWVAFLLDLVTRIP